MENATKALLIAAAVLVTILVISLGLVIYNRASENVNSAGNLSEYQIQQFNEKFLRYNKGTDLKAKDINLMLKTVFDHNIAQEDESTTVEVYYLGDDYRIGSDETIIQASINQIQLPPKVPIDLNYVVRIHIDENTHLIDLIQFYARGDTLPPE